LHLGKHLHDGHPITKNTLAKHFRHERNVGGAELKSLIVNKFWEKVENGGDWAIRAGLRNRFHWTFEGAAPPSVDIIGAVRDEAGQALAYGLSPSSRPAKRRALRATAR